MPRTSGLTIDLNNYAAFKKEMQTLDRVINDIDKRIDTASDSFDKLEKSVGKTDKSADKFEKVFKDTANTVKKETKNINDGVSRLQRTAQTLENIGTKISIGISAPAAAIKGFATAAAIEFESSFAGVIKTLDTTGLTAEETVQVLDEIRQGLRDLATDVESPLAGLENAHNELARIAELGGQLGIAREELLSFTEVIGQLTLATDLTADQAATNLAQFANIIQSTNFKGIGDTIVALGNNSATTESQIVEFGQRLAGAGAQARFSEADVLGFGAAMASVGLNAEAGGTAMTRVINEMIAATAGGGESLQTLAEVAGVSAEEFARAFEEDAAGAITQFIAGLGQLESAELLRTLETLGFSDIRVSDTLRRLAQAPELLADSLTLANQAFEEGGALQEEASKRFETTAAQINLLKNNIRELAISLGDAMLPGLNRGIDVLVGFIQRLQEASPRVLQVTAAILGIAAAAGPAILILSQIAAGIAFIAALPLAPIIAIAAAIGGIGFALKDTMRDFFSLANAARGFGKPNEIDQERNRLLDERKRLLNDILRLEEDGTDIQSESLAIQIEQGDTLWDIARRYDTTVEELMRLNDLDSSLITVGQELIITAETQGLNESLHRTQDELAAVNEQLANLPPSVRSAFDDETLLAFQAEMSDIRTSAGLVKAGFLAMVSGDVSGGFETIKSGLGEIGQSLLQMFNIFQESRTTTDTPLVALTGDIGAESGLFVGLKDRIKTGLEEIATGDYSGIGTLLSDNLGAVLTTAVTVLGQMFLPPLGLFIGLAAKAVGAMELDFADIKSLFQQSTILQSIQDGLASLFGGGGDEPLVALTSGMTARETVPSDFLAGIQDFIDDVSIAFEPLVLVWESSWKPALDTLVSGIGGFVSEFRETLDVGALSSALRNLTISVGFWLNVLGVGIGAVAEGIGNALPDLGAALGEFINIITRVLDADFIGAGLALWGTIRSLGNAIGSFVVGAADNIIGFLEDLTGQDFLSAEDVVTGIKDGLVAIGDIVIGEPARALFNFVTNITTGNFSNTSLGRFIASIPDTFANAMRLISREIEIAMQSLLLKWQLFQANTFGATEAEVSAASQTIERLRSLQFMRQAEGALGGEGFTLDVPISFEIEGREFAGTFRDFINTPGILDSASESTQMFLETALNRAAQNADVDAFNTILAAAMRDGLDLSALNVTPTDDLFTALAVDTPPEDIANLILGLEAGGAGQAIYDSLNQAIVDAATTGDTDLAATLFESLAGTFNEDAIAALGDELAAAGGADFAESFVNDVMIPGMTDAFGEFNASEIGADIIAGLNQGIADNADLVTEGAHLMTDMFQGAVNEDFGVESPSLWMQGVGLNLIEGLSQGILDNLPMMSEAANALNAVFDGVLLRVSGLIAAMTIMGPLWTVALTNITTVVTNLFQILRSALTTARDFLDILGHVPYITVVEISPGFTPGAPPPGEAITDQRNAPPTNPTGALAEGGPGFAHGLYRVAEPEIGGIEMIRQTGGGTYIISGKDFTAIPPQSAPIGALPAPPMTAPQRGTEAIPSSVVFNEPVFIENPTGEPVTPDTIAEGMQQWTQRNPPARQLRDSL